MGKQFTATTTRALGRIGQLRIADRRERQVADRPLAVPALEAGLGDDPSGASGGIEPFEPRQPVDPGEAVPELAAPLCVEEVVCEHAGVPLREAERPQPFQR